MAERDVPQRGVKVKGREAVVGGWSDTLWAEGIGGGGVVRERAVRCGTGGVEIVSAEERAPRQRREVNKDNPRGAVRVDAVNSLKRARS